MSSRATGFTRQGGRIVLGSKSSIGRSSSLSALGGVIEIGDRGFIGDFCVIVSRVQISIGTDCLIAERVTIRDQDHKVSPGKITAQNGFETAPICIGNNVWIGAGAVITKGVSIGDNAVIGAGAVVTRDIPPGATAIGVPARVRG